MHQYRTRRQDNEYNRIDRRRYDVLVENVELLGGGVLFQQLGGYPALCGQDDSILGQDADGGTGVRDGFKSVLDLVETSFWGEDSRLSS